MPTSHSFSKYHGAGNDFLLFLDFEENFPISEVARLCDRHLGIGADGLILARDSKEGDFQMVFFNADGSSADLCGNGIRCFAHFLADQGFGQERYLIEIGGRVLTVIRNELTISTYLPLPKVLHWQVPLENSTLFVVDAGVPHAVVFAQEGEDVVSKGGRLRHHPLFHPHGVNVNFVWEIGEDAFGIRTYERGVEKETLACGSGASAAAFVAHELGCSGEVVTLLPKSGEEIQVRVGKEMKVTGPSTKVFDGEVSLKTQ